MLSSADPSTASLRTYFTSGHKPLICAVSVAVSWWFVLGWLALVTANPVTLNRIQILGDEDAQVLGAEYVVTGTISDLATGTVQVEQEWKQDANLGEITVKNLNQSGGKPKTTYLIPLERISDHEYRVVSTRLPGGTPLIYPATEAAINQLTDLLK